MKKRFYQSTALVLSTALLLSANIADAFAAEQGLQKSNFDYIYVEDQCAEFSEKQHILVQLSEDMALPTSVFLTYHKQGDTKTEKVEVMEMKGNILRFSVPCASDEATIFLDQIEWNTEDGMDVIPFEKEKITYKVSENNETDEAIIYLSDGQSMPIVPIYIGTGKNIEESAFLLQKNIKNMPQESIKGETHKTTEAKAKPVETVHTTKQHDVQEDDAHTGGELFWDVQKGNWFYPAVSYVMNKGLMSGLADGNFGVSKSMNRAQLFTILYRMEGYPEVSSTSAYKDVPPNAFYTKAVLWAAQEGLLFQQNVNSLKPLEKVTKEEMIFTLCRYAEKKGFYTPTEQVQPIGFADANKIAARARNAVSWAVSVDLIHGDKNNLLNPKEETSRAVCASMITRFCDLYLPNQYPNISIYANADEIFVSPCDENAGTFTVTVSGVHASTNVDMIEAAIWCDADGNDKHLYQAHKQSDRFLINADMQNHKFHIGTYHITLYAVLSNGIRVQIGTQTAVVEGNEAQRRIQNHINTVYAQVGKELYACYQWVVQNMKYQKMPIPIQPPAGYTKEQWNAVYAFEQHKGNCFNFAAAFYELAKGLGYDARYVEGAVPLARGGRGPHGWVEITKDGAVYICDPDLQYEIKGRNFYMQPVGKPVVRYYR